MELDILVKNLKEGNLTSGLKEDKNILWFDELGIEDMLLVGNKNAYLADMYSNLSNLGVRVPYGFAVTANAYKFFIDGSGLKDRIRVILKDLDTSNLKNLQVRGKKIRSAIMNTEFPEILKVQIASAYLKLEKKYGENIDVAVRSSVVSEDLSDFSFAGQQETYLNVHTESQLIYSCKQCFASLFTDRAISYREDKNFSHFDFALSIGVQKMVRSDLSCSGVMSSIDTETGFDKATMITGAYGLGENIVQGAVNPDEFIVYKPTLEEGYRPIISRLLGEKHLKMVYDHSGNKLTKNIPVVPHLREQFVLTDDEVLALSRWAIIIEDYYSSKKGQYQPMDMEWAKDGETNELFIVQARPEGVHSCADKKKIVTYEMAESVASIIEGVSVGSKISHGEVKVINHISEAHNFKEGNILVTDMTDSDWEPIMKLASAVITNRGGRSCHAAIICREMGIAGVVGCVNATSILNKGQKVTVSCAEGKNGFVYDGMLKYKVSEVDIENIPETKTKIMLNIENPSLAFSQSFLPCDGVGLASEEFIINSSILIHPSALLNFDKLKRMNSAQAKIDVKKIEKLTAGYKDKAQYYVDKLAEGVGTIGAAFYPKKVIVRMSDFKSDEYANLIGGSHFESVEDNPMVGFRGSCRYYSEKFKEAFVLECVAIKKVREEFGLKNLTLMIPFCRTVNEAKEVLAVMKNSGLERGQEGLEIYLMCEVPSNVILVDKFLDLVDGYSLGTNNLTQLTLGLDINSGFACDIYDERDESVKDLVAHVINKCNDRNKYVGICGQAPSDYPEFAQFVVEQGIQSISLTADSLVRTKLMVAEVEARISGKGGEFNAGFNVKHISSLDSEKKVSFVKKKSSSKKKVVKKVVTKKVLTKKIIRKKK